MADKTGEEQQAICDHIRTNVLSSEDSSLDKTLEEAEFLVISADYAGKIEFITNKVSLSISEMKTKWTTHKDGCSDCEGWSF
ncbi:uncharacterized protein METZ01_LOCUS418344 [marine metagenome]|uniref:Uncharacterized protein n=1 Tax=marine metagenome TaxID=408172 RepID=A0A382X3Q2_9ZZZZ